MRTITLLSTLALVACGGVDTTHDAGVPAGDAGTTQPDPRCTKTACGLLRDSCSLWSLPNDVEARSPVECFTLPGEVGSAFADLCESVCQRTGGGEVHACVMSGAQTCETSTRDYCEGPGWCLDGETCTPRLECEDRTGVTDCLPAEPERDPACTSVCEQDRDTCEDACPAASDTTAACLGCVADCQVAWDGCRRGCEP